MGPLRWQRSVLAYGEPVVPGIERHRPIEAGVTVNERERLRRDDLSRSDAGGDMFTTISSGYVVCVMAFVLYVRLGALVRRAMR
jgi:hypothetical protein